MDYLRLERGGGGGVGAETAIGDRDGNKRMGRIKHTTVVGGGCLHIARDYKTVMKSSHFIH